MEQFTGLAVAIGVLVAIGIYLIVLAYQKPKKIKEWLIWACAQAELSLGAGTGKLKLRKVYDMFINQYPIFSNFISFKKFCSWAEESLDIFRVWLEKDEQAAIFFGLIEEGEEENEEEYEEEE